MLRQRSNQGSDLNDLGGIEPHRRFVEDQQIRLVHDGLRYPHPLSVALAQSAYLLGQAVCQTGRFRRFEHGLHMTVAFHAVEVGHQEQVALDR